MIGGLFMLLGAIVFIICGSFPFLLVPAILGVVALPGLVSALPTACCVVPAILGIIELIGGIFAIERRHAVFALTAATLGLNFFGIVFVAVGWKEFEN